MYTGNFSGSSERDNECMNSGNTYGIERFVLILLAFYENMHCSLQAPYIYRTMPKRERIHAYKCSMNKITTDVKQKKMQCMIKHGIGQKKADFKHKV